MINHGTITRPRNPLAGFAYRLEPSDLSIITARRRLLNLARELQQHIEPFPTSHGNIYRVRAMDVNVPLDDFDAVIANHGSGLVAKA